MQSLYTTRGDGRSEAALTEQEMREERRAHWAPLLCASAVHHHPHFQQPDGRRSREEPRRLQLGTEVLLWDTADTRLRINGHEHGYGRGKRNRKWIQAEGCGPNPIGRNSLDAETSF